MRLPARHEKTIQRGLAELSDDPVGERFDRHRQLGRLPLAERIAGLLAVRWEGLGW
jgi:hypothetical protein